MAKEAFYFSHDYDPTGDPKIAAMLSEHGGMGYGCFWRIVEMLHSDNNHRLPLKKYIFIAIAKQMLTSAENIELFIKNCIEDYELFSSDGINFWSVRVDSNLGKRALISEKRALAGKIGGQNKAIAKQNIANAKHVLAKRSKGKESNIDINIYSEFSFFNNGFDKHWNDFKELRVKLKKPLTKESERLNLLDLQKACNGNKEIAIKIIQQSIKRGWQGLFPLKDKNQQIEFYTGEVGN